MNRIFGRGKPKEPPPNINDCIAGVSICLCTNISYKVVMPNSLEGLVMKFVIMSSILGQYQNALNTT